MEGDIEPEIIFPVLDVLPCFVAVRPVNKDKGIVLNKVAVQFKHTVSSLRKLGQIKPDLFFHCLSSIVYNYYARSRGFVTVWPWRRPAFVQIQFDYIQW